MKKLYFILLCIITLQSFAQIITPQVKANFGVDGELRANFFNNFAQSGNDDWFNLSAGSGQFVIDTTGAAGIVAGYISNPLTRQLPFFRTMRYAPFSIVNNRMLIDAVFIRDYHGDDSTIFASGGNKNGDSPANWSCPVAQSVPDKNEILDMMVHVRRAGPNPSDSLWMFAGMSIENTSGSRYIDFEMYQTDIYYDRGPRQFFGYGPDAGHTTWQFNASGDITVPGDVIFTAEFGSSLSLVEARIWINQASLSMTPTDFDWTGSFDGAVSGATFGYAGIKPKTAGVFYTGLPCSNNTWGGPFQIVLGNNSVVNNYTANQYIEFSVNLTKLGLDPVTLLGSNSCGMPFRRVLAKSRASNSFTAALKDFVGPFDFFLAPRVEAFADIPLFCGTYNVSNLQVSNPVSTSIYEWSTLNGHFAGSNTGTSVYVDSPGTYIVTHRLQAGCSVYATDTVDIAYEANCSILASNVISLTGVQNKQLVELNWRVLNNQEVRTFQLERSTDGIHFKSSGIPRQALNQEGSVSYSGTDNIAGEYSHFIFYRLKMVNAQGKISFSKIIRLAISPDLNPKVVISPNPAKDKITINISSSIENTARISIYDISGKLIRTATQPVRYGNTMVDFNGLDNLERGIYVMKVFVGNDLFVKRFILSK